MSGLLGAAMVAGCSAARAESKGPRMVYQEYANRIKSAELVAPLGSDVFGESISLATGATEFSATDVSLPGNDALPMAIGRRLKIHSVAEFAKRLGGFGVWDIDVPLISGTFVENWMSTTNDGRRCTNFGAPSYFAPFEVNDFYAGVQLSLPGSGEQEVLTMVSGIAKLPLPNDGHVYKAGTRNFDRIRCKPTTANGFPGEGFIVKTQGGLTYTLDVGFTRDAGVIEKGTGSWEDPTDTDKVNRIRVYLAASRVEDRFGNWINYQWSGDKLIAITASDGRAMSLAWNGPNVQSITAAGRTWHYSYSAGGMRLTLPDSSYWQIDLVGSLTPGYFFSSGDGHCDEGAPPVDSEYAGQPRLTMRHPSGAVGTFEFDILRHRRNGIPISACQPISTRQGTSVYQLVIPNYFDTYSVIRKTISGPGVQAQAWRYNYSMASGEFDYANSTPCTSCAQWKSTLVTDPDGVVTESTFGAVWSLNEGRLASTRVVDAQGQQVRSQAYEYMPDARAANSAFPDIYGAATSGDDQAAHKVRPIISTRIVQQYDTFVRTAEDFDNFARPVRLTRTGALSP